MGGDGGTKAIQRAYLRNAGSATTTGDGARPSTSSAVDPTVVAQERVHRWTHCALTDQPLFGSTRSTTSNGTDTTDNNNTTTTTDVNSIVACPYGRLYFREAVVEALIRRKQHEKEVPSASAIGKEPASVSDFEIRHIRGLKDLYAVQFQVHNHRPVCPVTARELTGKGCVAYALLLLQNDNDDHRAAPVVSQYALQQIGEAELLQEYGATRKLRLAPPADVLVEIQQQWQEHCAAEKKAKKKRSSKKRSHQQKDKDGGDELRDDGTQCKKTKVA